MAWSQMSLLPEAVLMYGQLDSQEQTSVRFDWKYYVY